MRLIRECLAVLLTFGLLASAKADQKDVKAEKLVGMWKITKAEGPGVGATVELKKDGKLQMKIDVNGMAVTIDGSYKLDGDKLILTMKGPDGKEQTETEKIKSLTDDTLVTVDEKGKETELKKKSAK